MLRATERTEFERQIAILCAGFPPTFASAERIEAYWRGLQKMHMSLLVRCIDFALSEQYDEDKIPSPKQLWRIANSLRVRAAEPAKPEIADTRTTYGKFADHILFNFIARRGAHPTCVQKLVSEKNRLCAAYESIGQAERVEPEEFRDALVKSFEKHWKVPDGVPAGNLLA